MAFPTSPTENDRYNGYIYQNELWKKFSSIEKPHIYGTPNNTNGSGIANMFIIVESYGGLAFSSDRIIINISGLYQINFNTISDDSTGRFDAWIRSNKANYEISLLNETNGEGYHQKSGSIIWYMNKNDYIQFDNADWYGAASSTYDEWRTASVTLIN